MNAIIRTQFKCIIAGLSKIDQRGRSIRIREADRGRTGIKFPQDRRASAWIDNRAGERCGETVDGLIRSGIGTRRAGRSRTFARPGDLDHVEIADVNRGKIIKRG